MMCVLFGRRGEAGTDLAGLECQEDPEEDEKRLQRQQTQREVQLVGRLAHQPLADLQHVVLPLHRLHQSQRGIQLSRAGTDRSKKRLVRFQEGGSAVVVAMTCVFPISSTGSFLAAVASLRSD